MQIQIMTERWHQAYDEMLLSSEDSLFYQSSRYMTLLKELLGCRQTTLLAVGSTGALLAAMPLMEADGKYGVVVNSLPYYGSNGGVIGKNSSARKLLIDEYNIRVAESDIATATVVENPLTPFRVMDAAYRHEYKDVRIGQFTNIHYLVNHEEMLMTSFHYKTRNAVRKAWKLGSTVSIENDSFEFLEDTHNQNMLKIGGEPKSKLFFQLVRDFFNPGIDYNIYVTRINKEPVAALLVFYFNKTVEYYTPVVREEFRESQALSAAIYSAMCDASKAGFLRWNWGGTWLSQDGVYRFKSRWGTNEYQYNYYTTVQNLSLLKASKHELLSCYKSFYVVPFNRL